MKTFGYLIAAIGLYLLYENQIILGVLLLALGGLLSGGLSASVSSLVHVVLIGLTAYALQNEFTWGIISGIAFTIALVILSRSGGGDWEIEYCIFDNFLNFDRGYAGNYSDSGSSDGNYSDSGSFGDCSGFGDSGGAGGD